MIMTVLLIGYQRDRDRFIELYGRYAHLFQKGDTRFRISIAESDYIPDNNKYDLVIFNKDSKPSSDIIANKKKISLSYDELERYLKKRENVVFGRQKKKRPKEM